MEGKNEMTELRKLEEVLDDHVRAIQVAYFEVADQIFGANYGIDEAILWRTLGEYAEILELSLSELLPLMMMGEDASHQDVWERFVYWLRGTIFGRDCEKCEELVMCDEIGEQVCYACGFIHYSDEEDGETEDDEEKSDDDKDYVEPCI